MTRFTVENVYNVDVDSGAHADVVSVDIELLARFWVSFCFSATAVETPLPRRLVELLRRSLASTKTNAMDVSTVVTESL